MKKLFLISTLFLIGINSANSSIVDNRTFKNGSIIYSHALGGLVVRAQPSIKSEKLFVLVYGSKLTVLQSLKTKTVSADGIDGYWLQVSLGKRIGYIFSGYTSRYPAYFKSKKLRPTPLLSYGKALQRKGFDIEFSSKDKDDASHPSSTKQLYIKNATMLDGYLLARSLYSIPAYISLPKSITQKETTIKDSKKPDWMWSRELKVTANADKKIIKLNWSFRLDGSGGTSMVAIEDPTTIKLSTYSFGD